MSTYDFRLVGWDPHETGGECWVQTNTGMTIRYIEVRRISNGRLLVNPPSRPLLDSSGKVLNGPDGRPRYTPIFTFDDVKLRDNFNREVLEALLTAHPDALGEAPI